MIAKAVNKWPTTWKLTITVENTGSALRTRTARRMLRGCRRGNQVLIFPSEADLPRKPWAVPLNTATARYVGKNTQTKAPQTPFRVTVTLVEQPSPELLKGNLTL